MVLTAIVVWLFHLAKPDSVHPPLPARPSQAELNNSTVNLLTRFQEIEYALKFALSRFVQARLNILNIISGMGGIFRAEILHRPGRFDTGLVPDHVCEEIPWW
jgi:cellulose synthase/poly-beta-1,6-N-acetylglucosamine synthase-like glycosyltransferase